MIYKNAQIELLDTCIFGYLKVENGVITEIGTGDYVSEKSSNSKSNCNHNHNNNGGGCGCSGNKSACGCQSQSEEVIDCKGMHLLPGFIDGMVHGGFGHSFLTASKNDIYDYCKKIPQSGTTSFLAGVITNSIENMHQALNTISSYMLEYQKYLNLDKSNIIGINCEGPFLSVAKRGVHIEKYIIPASIEIVKEMQKQANGQIKMMACAIENAKLEFAKYLYNNDIIMSLAHSDCTFDQVSEFVKQGFLKHCTHLYNAMSAYNHRKPGCINGCLYYDEILCELIADGHHVEIPVLETTLKIKTANKICFVTDGTMASGMPDGTGYELAGLKVDKIGTKAVLAGTKDALSGSACLMKDLVEMMGNNTSADFHDIMLMSSYNIAQQLGLEHHIGQIKRQARADFVLLDDSYNLKATIISGKMAYQNFE